MKKRKIISCILLCALVLSACSSKKEGVQEDSEKDEIRVVEQAPPSEEEESASEETDEGDGASVGEEEHTDTEPVKKNILIAIDPGHQAWSVDMSAQEPNAPGSGVMKAKASTGTSGRYSGIPEYQLNLDISLMLRDELEKAGYDVIMTRENNETAISNSERAMLANNAGADISIRIHANGSEDSSVNGALALITSPNNPYTGHLYNDSYRLAEQVLDSYCQFTGFANRGIQQNDTMTGINWSEIPVMILEMGFMTNENDDMKMADGEFRKQMVAGIVNGIEKYYGE